jgi:hypothetical protein
MYVLYITSVPIFPKYLEPSNCQIEGGGLFLSSVYFVKYLFTKITSKGNR